MRHERSTKHDGKHSNGDIQTMVDEIKATKQLIDSLPDGPQKRQRINHLKRLYRKRRLLDRTSQNAHTSV